MNKPAPTNLKLAGVPRVLPVLLNDLRDNPSEKQLQVVALLDLSEFPRQGFPVYNRRKPTQWLQFAVILTFASDAKNRYFPNGQAKKGWIAKGNYRIVASGSTAPGL